MYATCLFYLMEATLVSPEIKLLLWLLATGPATSVSDILCVHAHMHFMN